MNLFGYLFTWDGFNLDEEKATSNPTLFDEALKSAKKFRDITKKDPSFSKLTIPPRWKVNYFQSTEPLAEEEPNLYGYYDYRIYIRVNDKTDTVVIAANRYKITEAAVATFNTYVTPKLQRKVIGISELAENLFDERIPKKFAVTYFLADVPGYGSALRTIALAGDDIANAGFMSEYEQHIKHDGVEAGSGKSRNFTARQVGLRPINARYECGRFGNSGTIQFPDDSIPQLEAFLAYAYQQGLYID